MKTRAGKGENHAEARTKNTWGQGQKTRGGNGEKRTRAWGKKELTIRSGGKGEGPILCSASFLARLAWLKGKGNDCNAGYYRFLSPPPPRDSTCNHNFVLITFIFVLVLIHEKQIVVQCGL